MWTRRRLAFLIVIAGVTLIVGPSTALAHGLAAREDLPIPAWLFGWAAALVLIASFVGLAVLWPTPRLETVAERRIAWLPRILDPLAGLLGVALFVLVIYAGLAGAPAATTNLAPTFIFVLFWVGLAVASPIFGDIFKAFNPWRAAARAIAWVASRVVHGSLPAPMAYPTWLGRWPAAIGILAFAWVELAYTGRGEPSNVAVLALVYAAVQFVGMSLYGIETWNRYGDGFAVYFGLFARMSPLRWTRGGLFVRKPLSGLATLDVVPGTVAVLCVAIGSTSFDGFSSGAAWGSLQPSLSDLFGTLGAGPSRAIELAYSVGLIAAVLIVAGLYRLGVAGMKSVDPHGTISTQQLAGRFVHSLTPIALAYVIAHYFSLLAFEGQRVAYLISDPFGTGANIFGTNTAIVDYAWIGASSIWYVQVAALVIGHVAALVLAHDRALVSFGDSRTAARSQYWMLAVMIAFTSLALWLLSAARA